MQDSRNEHLFPMKSFHVRLVDDNVAAIYESSRFATSDLKEHPRLVRRAVALGRACIEPLTVLCTLMASSPAELLSLQLHPLQVRHPQLTISVHLLDGQLPPHVQAARGNLIMSYLA